MKTAKEMCEELKNKDIDYILQRIELNYGTYHWYNHSYEFHIVEKNRKTLEDLGYKVELKSTTHVHEAFWFWQKDKMVTLECYVVSACCGEEK